VPVLLKLPYHRADGVRRLFLSKAAPALKRHLLPLSPQLAQEVVGLVHYLKEDGCPCVSALATATALQWHAPPSLELAALQKREEGRLALDRVLRERARAEQEEEDAKREDDQDYQVKPRKKGLAKKGQVLKQTKDRQRADKGHRNSVTSTSKKQLLVSAQQRRMSSKKQSWLPEEGEPIQGKIQK